MARRGVQVRIYTLLIDSFHTLPGLIVIAATTVTVNTGASSTLARENAPAAAREGIALSKSTLVVVGGITRVLGNDEAVSDHYTSRYRSRSPDELRVIVIDPVRYATGRPRDII